MRALPQLFSILSALVEDRAGLHYKLPDSSVFLDRVTDRAVEAGFDSLLDYYYFLRYDDAGQAELDDLVESLVVHETYFFRELEPVRFAVEELVAPQVMRGLRPRIWSAACSTGEEPLTLAMVLAERDLLGRVDIVASDISRRALERARQGQFSERSLRTQPAPSAGERWLTTEPGRVSCHSALIGAISWRQLNLLDAAAVATLGTFDVILCRNVLIYFSDTTARRVIGSLTDALVAGGVLLVGVSESLLRFSTVLECQERNGIFVYQKPAASPR